jgi:phosphatidate cytidylyltransferase
VSGRTAGGAREGKPQVSERKTIDTGRNLPVALAVGGGLGALALVTLLFVKVAFLVMVAVIVGVALWELSHVLRTHEIKLAIIPVGVGGAAAYGLAYWGGTRPAFAALALTFVLLLAWRLPGGAQGFVRDTSASVFALTYLPAMAVFVPLMLAQPDGAHRTIVFLLLVVCSDTGAYFAGISFGRHLMAPTISPKKTWEGLAGSVVACLAAGALGMVYLLHGHVWSGLVLGVAAAAAATLGDLVESMIKRDLNTKDMSSILPGHGGMLDRIDAMLMVAPVAWLLMTVFLGGR